MKKKTLYYTLSAILVIVIGGIFFLNEPREHIPFQLEASDGKYGNGVIDIDNNHYQTIIIGQQEWMTSNLKVTKYNDSTTIVYEPIDLDWQNKSSGAYSIYPHQEIDGINSNEEVINAYGLLYNWKVVESGKVCPKGWRVPTLEDWEILINYLINNYDDISNDNLGNILKSCRQINSPLNDNCNVLYHPRWNFSRSNFGTNDLGFNALPGGYRKIDGSYGSIGKAGLWWTFTKDIENPEFAKAIQLSYTTSDVRINNLFTLHGFSIRCLRDNPENQ